MDYHMQFLKFLSLLQNHGQSYAISGISFSFSKNVDYHMQFLKFILFSKNVDYHMLFLEFLFFLFFKTLDFSFQFFKFFSLLQKCGLSYAISEISFYSPKSWTIICNFWNFFLFSKNLDYHMQFLEFFPFSKNVDSHMHFFEFLFLFKKGVLSYAISEISFSSPKSRTTICNL